MGLSQILNRLPRTKTLPKFNFLSQSRRPLRILACSILAITSRNFIENQLLYAEDSSGYSPFSFCNPTLLLGIPITSFHTSIHGSLAEAQVPLEADEDDNHSATPVANQATKEAEKICRLLSNHPTNSGYESALDNCGIEVSPILVLEVLKKLSNAGVLTLSFFRWAEKQKWFKHTTESYNALIEALGKIKQFKMIDSLVISMKSKWLLTKDTFMLIMRRYARARKVKEAIQTFERMESFGLKPDSSDFNRFLDTQSKSRQVKHAQQMFDKTKKRRFAPDVKSYAILLEGWGQEQNQHIHISIPADESDSYVNVEDTCTGSHQPGSLQLCNNSTDCRSCRSGPSLCKDCVHILHRSRMLIKSFELVSTCAFCLQVLGPPKMPPGISHGPRAPTAKGFRILHNVRVYFQNPRATYSQVRRQHMRINPLKPISASGNGCNHHHFKSYLSPFLPFITMENYKSEITSSLFLI